MKFAHIADVHLGFEQYRLPFRAEEFAESFRMAIEIALRERADFILISGDLFHSSRPSPETIKQAIEILSLPKEKGIPVFAIEGNHDRTQRKVSVYNLLEDLGLLNLVGIRDEKVNGEFLRSERIGGKFLIKGIFNDIEIHGLKYMSPAWHERNRIKGIFKPRGKAILMLHQGIKEIIERMTFVPERQRNYYEIRLGDLPGGYLYYAMGHIHKNFVTSYDIGKVVYPGSLERWDFGDYEVRYAWDGKAFKPIAGTEKGFYIVEDFEPRFIKLDVRPFIDVKIKANEAVLRKELKRLAPRIPREAFVRVDVEWERPFDVAFIYETIRARHVQVRTRFGRRQERGPVKPEEYFTEAEKKIIELLGGREIEDIDAVIEILSGIVTERKESVEEEPKVERKFAPPKKKGDILAWLGGGG
ncbi:DNA double-strand break repair protein Mre11 [Pyrococcus yayanosii]|uniref:DNA double-strand break repair protein Mre11 n=1 Tax=Pyrococcus yayanosii (strain CH1 / JCM 16557) TaxID=529709 RepID=F8AI77_PYRYC|nr:DNA double-strand break repair protein Mre11 [Pyrococcus yayanosii]AEH24306.1 DNA repair exonuclease [Pyrococcus yayanosii CH1]